jgi:hypothetical protein
MVSSCLDDFIMYKPQRVAIHAISAIPDPTNSQNSANSHASECVQNTINTADSSENRHTYLFVLSGNEGGGTYICDTADLEHAREALLKRYGNRLIVVTRIGDCSD